MSKPKLVFNKPAYLEMCILDISKTFMYDFHYNYIRKKFGEKTKLLYTDNDSLFYEVEHEDIFKVIAQDVHEWFDTSNYPNDHPSGIEAGVNKKVIGKFKDEAGGLIIEEFVGLRSKLYSFRKFEGEEKKVCKGTTRKIFENNISFDDYKKCLLGAVPQMREINLIRNHGHQMYAETVNKVALSANDNKQIIRDDRIHNYACGHYAAR